MTQATTFLKGGDFSNFQNRIDTKLYPATGHQFLATKAIDGLSHTANSFLNGGRQDAHIMGMPIVMYAFFRFADMSPVDQAKNFFKVVGPLQKGEGVAGDYEWDNMSSAKGTYGDGKATNAHGNDLFYAFKSEVEQLFGVPMIIYTGRSFMPMVDARFAKNPLWVFDYHTTARQTPHVGQKPILPPTWSDFAFWQYTDREATSGSGAVDMNVFNGDMPKLMSILKQ